jgi:transglutaminase-like putative cysteine protease
MPQRKEPAPTSPWLTAAALGLGIVLLFPLVRGGAWYLTALGVTAILTACYDGLRRLPPQGLLAPIGEAVALLLLLVVFTARDVAPLGFVPGPAALTQLRQALHNGVLDANSATAPANATTGLIALIVLAVGGLTIIAHAFTEFADPVGLGWPFLILYVAVSAIVRKPISWGWFSIAATGWLVLLAGREQARLIAWGRVLDAPRLSLANPNPSAWGPKPNLTHLTSAARQVGATALVLAVVVPLLLPPGNHLHLFRGSGSGNGLLGSGGSGPTISISPIVSLKRDLVATDNRTVLTYSVSAGTVPYLGSPEYLRMVVLDNFDGTNWTSGNPDTAFNYTSVVGSTWPLPPGVPDGTALTGPLYNVQVGPLDGRAVPVPPLVGAVRGQGIALYDEPSQTVRSTLQSIAGQHYTVLTLDWVPTTAQLRSAGAPTSEDPLSDAVYPTNTPQSIIALAHTIAGKSTTAYDTAVAIQNWLRTFAYSTAVSSRDDTNYLLQFLHDRKGYCQQFAATMALFARVLDIPARVVVGFAPGSPVNGSYVVTVHDAHAWPELYFHGVGWVRFEPTPRADISSGIAVPNYAVPLSPTTPITPSTTKQSAGGKTKVLDRAETAPVSPTGLAINSHAGQRLGNWLLPFVILLLLLPNVRRVRRRIALRRGDASGRSEAVWQELAATAGELGRPWSKAASPRQVGAGLAALSPDVEYRSAVDRIVNNVEGARYRRLGADAKPVRLASELRTVRRTIWRNTSWTTRLRAALLPARGN